MLRRTRYHMSEVSFAEYARHREVSRAAVTQAVKDGRIPTTTNAKGKRVIDVEAADRAWTNNTRHDKRANGQAKAEPDAAAPADLVPKPMAEESAADESPSSAGEDDSKKSPTVLTSRQVREEYQARLAKIEWEEKTKAVLPAEDV